MMIRTLSFVCLFIGLQGPLFAQDPVLPSRTPADYAEADLARLATRFQMRPEQIEDCRRILVAHETALFEQREALRREIGLLDQQYARGLQDIAKTLDEEQASLFTRALKAGELPITWEVATPGSVRMGATQPAKPAGKEKPTKPASSTTLSR
ncbi:MAG TPA: hypothetical protein PKA92_06685 [Flavobacteriales bacterium]|nr:hypothetical protein [Flavobacteriales bacterium]